MTRTESANTLLMWQMATVAIFHSFLLLFGFRWPAPIDAVMLVLSGVAWAIGQYLWTRALLFAPTTAVSPFYYLLLVWAMAIGYLVWGDVPTIGLLIGSGIVVASGLFLLWHETMGRSEQFVSTKADASRNRAGGDPVGSAADVLAADPRPPAFSLPPTRQ
jgi:drug/metabolite transporter (DMT)-like permease